MAVQAEHDFWGTISVVLLSIVGVASLAVIVAKNANTVGVIQATGAAFSSSLGTALSPIVGMGNSSTFPIN